MADCMTTEEFLSEWQRMCDTVKICMRCDIPVDSITGASCIQFVRKHRETAIRIVQKWSDEHPLPKPKTYEDELKKLLPASLLYRKNMDGKQEVYLCRQMLFDSEPPYCNGYIVDKVCMKCWNEPYPEKEVSNE